MTRRLAVLSADPGGPSVRHRWTRIAPRLAEEGLSLFVVTLPREGRSRDGAFAEVAKADVVVLQRRLLRHRDFGRLRSSVRRLVYDFDDAMPYRDPFRGQPQSTARANRFLRTCAESDAVVAGSEELAALARPCGPRALFVAPTPVDPDRYGPCPSPRAAGEPFRPGWIGSRATLPYLAAIAAPLATVLAENAGSRLLVVADVAPGRTPTGSPTISGGPADAAHGLPGVPVEHVPWSEEGEADALRRMDAGVMPLEDDPWSRGKCGFKLLQYAATGIPSIASPVGANVAIVEHGRTGFLASGEEEWMRALRRLAAEPALRAEMGAAARRVAEARWSARVLAPPLARFLAHVAEAPPAGGGA